MSELRGTSGRRQGELTTRATISGRPRQGAGTLPVFAAVLSIAACGTAVEPPVEETLSFALARIEGMAIPVTLPSGFEWVDGHFSVWADGSCLRSLTIRANQQADPTEAVMTCTWSQSATDVTLEWRNASVTTGTWVADVLALYFPTGVVCIRAPCPSGRTEEYERSGGSLP